MNWTNIVEAGSDLNKDHIDRLAEEIGRCLMTYQSIEIYLKVLLPHLAFPGTAGTVQSEVNWRSLLDSKQTLGPLFQLLFEKMEYDSPDLAKEYFHTLVHHRNELVHHLQTLYFDRADHAEALQSAINDVRYRRQYALPVYRALKAMLGAFAIEVSRLSEPD